MNIMKKFIIATAILFTAAFAANAQPRAIGARFGYGIEASYQHSLGQNFLEFDLGAFAFRSLTLSGVYNIMIAQPAWTPRGEWGFYAGPGLAFGTGFGNDYNLSPNESSKYAASIALAAQAGLEYTFWFPLQLSIDLRPEVGVAFGERYFAKAGNENNVGTAKHQKAWFHENGLYYGFVPTLSVRYRF